VMFELSQQEQIVAAAFDFEHDEQESAFLDLVIEGAWKVVGTGGENGAIVRRASGVAIATIGGDDADILDSERLQGCDGGRGDFRDDLEAEDASLGADQMTDQGGVPSAAGAEFEYGLARLELQQIEHAQHERGLRNGGEDVAVSVAEEHERPVGVERGEVLREVFGRQLVPFGGSPLAVASDEEMSGVGEISLFGGVADRRLGVDATAFFEEVELRFFERLHVYLGGLRAGDRPWGVKGWEEGQRWRAAMAAET